MRREEVRNVDSARNTRDVVADALEALEREGVGGVEIVLEKHPKEASRVRSRLNRLRALGLLDEGISATASTCPGTLGRFTLERRLGEGGMGVVYLAEDPKLGRQVALKTLSCGGFSSPESRRRFGREARILAQLQHPRLVPIFEVGEHQGVPYFTMEVVDGASLSEWLDTARSCVQEAHGITPLHLQSFFQQRGERNSAHGSSACPTGRTGGETSYVEWCCRRILEVAEGLSHAHSRGVVHRDLKPSNVRVSPGQGARILDFGLARLASDEDLTRTNGVVGTPQYMAPEVAKGAAQSADARTDVYGLAVTLYELLTLRRPFDHQPSEAVLAAVLSQEPPSPRRLNPSIPRDLEVIVVRGLEKDPSRRYATPQEMADDLVRFLEYRPIHARPPGPWTRLARWGRRRPAAAVGIASALLMCLGLVVTNVLRQAELRREADAQLELVAAMKDILFGADIEELGEGASARDLLMRGAHRLPDLLQDHPLAVAELIGAIGATVGSLGELEDAQVLIEEGLRQLSSRTEAEAPLLKATLLNYLANVQSERGLHGEAGPNRRTVLDLRRKVLGPDHLDTLQAAVNFAWWLTSSGERSAASEFLATNFDGINIDEGNAEILGTALMLRAKNALGAEDAERFQRATQRVVDRYDLPAALRSSLLEERARLHVHRGELEQAAERFAEAVGVTEPVYGSASVRVCALRIRLAGVLRDAGHAEEAHEHLTETLENLAPHTGSEASGFRGWAIGELGLTEFALNDEARGRAALQRATEILRPLLPSWNLDLACYAKELAFALSPESEPDVLLAAIDAYEACAPEVELEARADGPALCALQLETQQRARPRSVSLVSDRLELETPQPGAESRGGSPKRPGGTDPK